MTKKFKGELVIGRPSFGSGEEYITIEIRDSNSRITFVEAYVKYDDFTRALTGCANQPILFEKKGLKYVGMVRETKDLIFKVPDYMGAKEFAEKTCQAFTDEGWTADGYFRSQSSIRKHDDGFYYAHGGQYRFVEEETLTKSEEEENV